MSFSVSSTITTFPENHPYAQMKEKILGKRYNLSLVFVGKTRAKTLNEQYRNKSYSPNILSFPLDEQTGEIFICPHVTKTEADIYSLTPNDYIAFLFIHGCLHLKGYVHGDTMDALEKKWVSYFKLR